MLAKYSEERITLPREYVPGKVGVVTVLYNSASVLPDFFLSIERQTHRTFVVYCIDNGSTDGSVGLCRSRDERYIVIENEHNVGVAAGNNVGIRTAIEAGCQYVLLLNNDVLFDADLFDKLVDGIAQFDCAMTSPVMYYYDRPDVIWAAGGRFQPLVGYRPLHNGDGDVDRGLYKTAQRIGYTPTCCVLIRRELFSVIGMMDERYFAYWDDADFMLRAYRFGASLYLLPDAKLWHKVSSLIGTSSPFRDRLKYRNHALYEHKHLWWLIAWLVSSVYCGGYLLLFLTGRLQRGAAAARIRYWLEGIRLAGTTREHLHVDGAGSPNSSANPQG